MVLALPNPDDGVVFLGQFGRERAQDEREHAGVEMRMRREHDYLIDELDCAKKYREHSNYYLRRDRPSARLERISAQDRFEIESVLDLRAGRTLQP